MKVNVKRHSDNTYTIETITWFDKCTFNDFNYILSRYLTKTTGETESGIFSGGKVSFIRQDENDNLKAKIAIVFPYLDWNNSDIYEVSAEIKNRVNQVKKAFEQVETHTISFNLY